VDFNIQPFIVAFLFAPTIREMNSDKGNNEEFRWKRRVHQLKKYLQENGDCDVPIDYQENLPLAKWVLKQRSRYSMRKQRKFSKLTDDQIAELTDLGFAWESNSKSLNEESAKPAKLDNAAWRNKIKHNQEGKQSSLTDARIVELESIGFESRGSTGRNDNDAWQTQIQDLKEFREKNGHCRVPHSYAPNPSLGAWVSNQRTFFKHKQEGKQSSLTDARIVELESISFEWQLVDKGGTWKKRFQELNEFREKNGHCQVPQGYAPNPSLGAWVSNQRTFYKHKQEGKQSSLTDARIVELESIGFEWQVRGYKGGTWKKRIQELNEFREKNGHCQVPQGYAPNPSLGPWVSNQRTSYKHKQEDKKSKMTDARIVELESVGFEWQVRGYKGETWKKRIQELNEFREKNGHCRVPYSYAPNPSLAKWVKNQRAVYKRKQEGKKSSLTDARIVELESIGFEWQLVDKGGTCKKRIQELNEFRENNGHCRVPHNYAPNPSLAKWVSNQRTFYKHKQEGKQSSLTDARIAQLESIGFEWRGSTDNDGFWKKRIQELNEFREKNGHCQVPQGYAPNPSLGAWVSNQRTSYKHRQEGKKSSLTDARIVELESVGFEWQVREDNDGFWKKRFQELNEFREKNGHCRVPYSYAPNKSLGAWVKNQRTVYKRKQEGKKSSLTDARIVELESIGFEWILRVAEKNLNDEALQTRIQELRNEFREENEYCREVTSSSYSLEAFDYNAAISRRSASDYSDRFYRRNTNEPHQPLPPLQDDHCEWLAYDDRPRISLVPHRDVAEDYQQRPVNQGCRNCGSHAKHSHPFECIVYKERNQTSS